MPKNTFSPDILNKDPIDLQEKQRKKKHANPMKNEILRKKGMKKDWRASPLKIFGSDYFFNYELSWLEFNQRVLSEAKNPDNPLLERVKFISIVCSNLDEFFQKRVGGLKRQLHAGVKELSVDGRTPEEQLSKVRGRVGKMFEEFRTCYFEELLPSLEQEGIFIREYKKLSAKQKKEADDYFDTQIYPLVTPLAVDESHPFPFISNKSRSFAVKLIGKGKENDKETYFARIKIPSNRPRWMQVEGVKENEKAVLVSVSDIMSYRMNDFFPGLEVESAHIFRVTRNADIERNEEEADDLLEMIEDELRERRFSEVVRLEVDDKAPESIKGYLLKNLKIEDKEMFEITGPIGLVDCAQLYELNDFEHLKFDPWIPVLHSNLMHNIDTEKPDIFNVISKGDFMVHHPYHSFESSTQRFVEQASRDPRVLAIKQTLYRTSSDSPVMHALIQAAESGKQVAVLVELKARFDEERNIGWAQKLEKAGVHVSYGLTGLKIHSKVTIVIREEEDGLRRYVHIGTGNYHPDTAQLYEDLGYFTSDHDIGADVTNLFNLLTGYAPDQQYDKLFVAPRYMRSRINRLIERETENAKKGEEARIIGKMNNLEDPLIIQKLYEASRAGVQIDLIVRSVCRLIPGKKGLSENIRVHAIIGRFLEHSRCYYFRGGGEHEYLIGSADWMHRNLDARVEVLVPIESRGLKRYLQFLLNLNLRDNQQRWQLQANGTYLRVVRKKNEKKIALHQVLMNHTHDRAEPVPTSDRHRQKE